MTSILDATNTYANLGCEWHYIVNIVMLIRLSILRVNLFHLIMPILCRMGFQKLLIKCNIITIKTMKTNVASQKFYHSIFLTPDLSRAWFESCSNYKTEIVKHFHRQPIISWAMIAWSFKKHRFPKRFWPFFTGKCFWLDNYATCGSRVTLQYHFIS